MSNDKFATPWLYKINNVLDVIALEQLEAAVLSVRFPWYWKEHTLHISTSPHADKTVSQFIHVFYANRKKNSELNAFAEKVLEAIEAHTPIRITHVERTKANLLCTLGDVDLDQRPEIHPDIVANDGDWYSAVYYVGISDGDTVFYTDDETTETGRAAHERNSMVVFKSQTKHRASLPRKHKRRVVFNLIFRGKL